MRGQVVVLRRLVEVSVLVAGAGLVLAGCSAGPVKMGAAAITGGQRITIATLATEVADLSQAVRQYPGVVQLSPAQQTQETLTWLVRFQVNEELARQAGLTVTTAQAEAALAEIYAAAKSQAQAQGLPDVTLELILAANGIPPDLSAEVGRYQAIENQFVRQANGGTLPATTRRRRRPPPASSTPSAWRPGTWISRSTRSSASWTTPSSRSSPPPTRSPRPPARPAPPPPPG